METIIEYLIANSPFSKKELENSTLAQLKCLAYSYNMPNVPKPDHFLSMKYTEWTEGLLGDTRVFNDEYQIRHHNGNVKSFDSKEELEDYLQEYFLNQCDLSSN